MWTLKDQMSKDHVSQAKLPSSVSHTRLQLPERVYKLKLESDLTPIPGILKSQHHAANVELDQS